jgi:copper chaperone CopZ
MSDTVIHLQVEGMTCGTCVRHVREGLQKVPGVTAVDVKLDVELARVTHNGSVSTDALLAAVVESGYTAKPAA